MSKRYAEVVEIETTGGALQAFWWRGKRYTVRRVLGRWREAGGWWTSTTGTDRPWTAGESRELVRVQTGGGGTYELGRDLRSGAWMILRVWD